MDEKTAPKTNLSIAALKSGDQQELSRFVEVFSPTIYRLALKMMGNEADAEDVLQETFLKAIHAMGQFQERSSLSTWLYRIAVNEALMMIRKRRPDVESIDQDREGDDGQIEPKEVVDWCCLPEQELTQSETRRILDQAIQGLSPALRAVFVLRDIEGLSIQQTAEALHLGEPAVKTRLLRARLKLREVLSVYFADRMDYLSGKKRPAEEEVDHE